MSKIIAIIGATGTQGGSVVETFLATPGWKVRGITRDPSKASSLALAARGVEVVQGDVEDPKSLITAFRGATAIFGVTDFWGIFFNPASTGKVKQGQIINEYAYEVELQYGKNIVDAAATVKGLERFIWSTLPPVRKLSKGKYTWMYHFDGKAAVKDYLLEEHKDLAKKTSFVNMAFYASNQLAAPMAPKKQADGTFLLAFPGNGEKPQPIIDSARDTGPFVKALIEIPAGKNLLAYGSMISWNDWMKLWCEINGVKGSFESMSLYDFEKASPGFGREGGESFVYASDLGYDGGDPTIVHPKDLGVPMDTVRVKEWMRKADWSGIL